MIAASAWSLLAPASWAGESKEDVLASAKTMVAQSAVACTVVDAKRAPLASMAGPSRGRGRRGGGMGGGFGGMTSGGPGGGEGRFGGGEPEGFGAARDTGSDPGDGGQAQDRGGLRSTPKLYEVACEEGVGFMFIAAPARRAKPASTEPSAAATPDPTAPEYLNCLEAKEAAEKNILPVKCELKANARPIVMLQGIASRLGLDCEVKEARGLGHAGDKSFFEIACLSKPDGDKSAPENGYILIADRGLHGDRPAMAFPCYDAQSNPKLRCELTRVGPLVEALHRFVDKAVPGCAAMAERLAGLSASGDQVFEVRCRNGDGYLARRTGTRAFDAPVACAAQPAAGACRLAKADPSS
jgi:hypothetical protein